VINLSLGAIKVVSAPAGDWGRLICTEEQFGQRTQNPRCMSFEGIAVS